MRSAIAVQRPYETDARTTTTLAPGGLDRFRLDLLRRVRQYGRVRMDAVPARAPLSRRDVRRLLEGLVADGLLLRSRDGRVGLTPAGLARLVRDAPPAR